jgi:hypothetical protein
MSQAVFKLFPHPFGVQLAKPTLAVLVGTPRIDHVPTLSGKIVRVQFFGQLLFDTMPQ